MQLRKLGSSDISVSAIGMGGMQLSVIGRPANEKQSVETIHAALDAGITFFDTADSYCLDSNEVGHNERLFAKTLKGTDAIIATKGGHIRPEGRWETDGRPAYLREACEASLRALDLEAITLYQFHRPDPKVPYEESIGAIADLQREGKIVHAGVSNVSLNQLDIAMKHLEVVSVQNEMNVFNRSSFDVMRRCEQLGIAFLPYSPLHGKPRAGKIGENHIVASVATKHQVTPQQVALAWLLQTSPIIIPIPGASRSANIINCAEASQLTLDEQDMQQLNSITSA